MRCRDSKRDENPIFLFFPFRLSAYDVDDCRLRDSLYMDTRDENEGTRFDCVWRKWKKEKKHSKNNKDDGGGALEAVYTLECLREIAFFWWSVLFITNIQSAEAIGAHPKIISISRCVAYSLYTYNIYDSSYPLLIIQFQFYSHSRSIILSHKIPFYSIQSSRSRKRIINFFLCLLIHSFLLSTFPSLVLPFCMYIFCRSVFFSCFFFWERRIFLVFCILFTFSFLYIHIRMRFHLSELLTHIQ